MASWGRCGGRVNSCVGLLEGDPSRRGGGGVGFYFEEVGVAGGDEVDVGVGGISGLWWKRGDEVVSFVVSAGWAAEITIVGFFWGLLRG